MQLPQHHYKKADKTNILVVLDKTDYHSKLQNTLDVHSRFKKLNKLRGCRYERIEEMKEAVTKVIDTLAQEDFHGAFQKLLERYNKCIAAGGDYFEGD